MQNLMAFEYENQAIRVIHGENGEPWIVAPIMACVGMNVTPSKRCGNLLDESSE